MRVLTACTFILMSLSTHSFAEILNWDSRIPLSQGRTEYVCEVVTKYEAESQDTNQNCLVEKIKDLELTRSEFLDEKLSNFTVRSRLVLSGPNCRSSSNMICETNFKYNGPQEWEVQSECL